MLSTDEIREILSRNISEPADRWSVMIGVIEGLVSSHDDPRAIIVAIHTVINEGDRIAHHLYDNAE